LPPRAQSCHDAVVTVDAEMTPAHEASKHVTEPHRIAPIRSREWFVAAALALILWTQLLASVRQLSQTSDEANHLHAGYRYWQCRDYGYNVQVPPLAKLVAALPLRLVAIREPFPAACGMPLASEFQMGRQFLYAGTADRLLTLGRTAVSLFALATLLLAWFWTRMMFGRVAAAITAILLAFEPNLLAHGALITTDAALAFGMLASVAAVWFCARRRTWTRVALAGAAVGMTLAAKFPGIIVVPVVAVMLAIEIVSRRNEEGFGRMLGRGAAAAIIAAGVALLVLWATYGFRFTARPGAAPIRWSRAEWEPAAPRLLPALLKTRVLPEAYVVGLGYVLLQTRDGQPAFLFGKLYATGRWFYFPAVLLIKLTLPLLLLTVAVIVSRAWRGRARDTLYVALAALLFLGFAMQSRFDIGVRHVLPVIVLLAILAGSAAAACLAQRPWAAWAIAVLVLFHIVSSLHVFPDYISYANEAWGGPSHAYRLVTDSNTDWGQALKEVGRAAAKSGSPCWVLSPYQIPLAYYGVLCRDLRIEPAATIRGTVFVSSTAWSGVLTRELGYDSGESFRGRKPAATLGGSAFLVYDGDIDLHTNLSLIYSTTAQVLLAQGRAREALDYAQRASQLRPDAGTPHYVACAAEAAAGAPDLARHECSEAIRLLDRNPEFNRRLIDAISAFVARSGLQP
jgi:4-amino-4-deoxy-L-arabinose transferase-like glycosyltransferase